MPDFRKLCLFQAAEEALRFLETTTDPQIKKHLRPIRLFFLEFIEHCLKSVASLSKKA
jgi:hypothetical protein